MPNQIDCFRPIARWAEALTEARAIPGAIAGAFDLLRTGRLLSRQLHHIRDVTIALDVAA